MPHTSPTVQWTHANFLQSRIAIMEKNTVMDVGPPVSDDLLLANRRMFVDLIDVDQSKACVNTTGLLVLRTPPP